MIKTLHIVHPLVDFSTINHKSILLRDINVGLLTNEYHSSLADLTSHELLAIVRAFDIVYFHPESFVDKNEDLYKETIVLLTYIKNFKTVKNFNVGGPVTFIDNTDVYVGAHEPTLWVFGCSQSHGVGLHPHELKYSEILSKELNIPLKLVSKPGSSLHWSLRHLMAANITSNDIVVWQITAPSRISVYNGSATDEVLLARTSNRHLIEVYDHQQIFFNHMSLLSFGIHYLRTKNVNFVLTSIEDHSETTFRSEYVKYPEYCYSPGVNVDVGTDGLHYGPLSHKRLASALLNHIQSNHVNTI